MKKVIVTPSAMSFSLKCLFLFVAVTAVKAELTDECLQCMCVASSGCVMPDPPCGTTSWGSYICGPWAFNEPYWIDGGRLGEGFEECGSTWSCSEDTVRGYMARYVTDPSATCETYSRTHVGGPWGAGSDNTLEYWYTVEDCLENPPSPPPSTAPPPTSTVPPPTSTPIVK